MIFLGVHSRLTDVALHIEICKWQGFPVYVLFQGPNYPPELNPTDWRWRPLNKSNQGSGDAFLQCVDWAHDLGIKRMIYSNGDDWLLNKSIRDHALNSSAEFMGYNWFGCGTMDNFTINEVVLDVEKFYPFLGDAWNIFGTTGCVEADLAAWVRLVKPTFERMEGREKPCSVGCTFQSSSNSRFFNRAWGMLGYHDLEAKRRAYHRLCKEPYMQNIDILESMPHFKAWLKQMDICDCKENSYCPHLCKKLIGRIYELSKDMTGIGQPMREQWRRDCGKLGKRPVEIKQRKPCGCRSIKAAKPA